MDTPKILEIEAAMQLQKSPQEVFEAIANPTQMSNYFVSQSSGRMESGAELIWKFPEFEGEVPIRMGEVRQDEYISYFWKNGTRELFAEMTIRQISTNSCVLTVTEKNMPNDAHGIKWL